MAVTENSAPCTPRTEYFLRFHLTLIPSPQIPLAKAQSEALGCRTFSMEGYEADDVMATLARCGTHCGRHDPHSLDGSLTRTCDRPATRQATH